MLLAHRSTGDVIRNRGEQSALQAPPHGRPQQGSPRSACTATPHNGLPQGGVQSARGRLPGAKIGVSGHPMTGFSCGRAWPTCWHEAGPEAAGQASNARASCLSPPGCAHPTSRSWASGCHQPHRPGPAGGQGELRPLTGHRHSGLIASTYTRTMRWNAVGRDRWGGYLLKERVSALLSSPPACNGPVAGLGAGPRGGEPAGRAAPADR